jgi:hypothetical protein
MVRVSPERLWHDPFEPGFNFVDCLAGRHSSPVAHAEDVRVDGKGFLSESCVQDNIGGLPANAGEFL